MSTRTVIRRSAAWNKETLNDGWGANISVKQAGELSELVVDRFHDLCEEHGGSDVYWDPNTSEVTAEVYGRDTDEHNKWDRTHPMDVTVDDLINEALDDVWMAGAHDLNTAVKKEVDEILSG